MITILHDDAAFPGDRVNDAARLAAVRATALLDTPPESAFDDLTRIAALVTGAPFAFVTLVDDVRSYWKSTFGLPSESPHENTVEESFCKYVVRTEQELCVTDAAEDERTRENPSVRSMGVRAWLGFPIRAPGGEVLGSFCVVDTSPRAWPADDVELVRTLAAAASREISLRAAVRSERDARLRAEELSRTLQLSLLPPALADVPGLDVAARYHPAGTGLDLVGDFYDVFASRRGRWSFVVGDVCGKGIEAAKVAALARYMVAGAAMEHDGSASVLSALNDALLARGMPAHAFLTAIYGTMTVGAGSCSIKLSCAGHSPPIVKRAGGTTEAVAISGPLIGVLEAFAIEETEIRLDAGDALIVYTDGVDEARRGDALFGSARLIDLIAAAPPGATSAEMAQRIEDAALDFGGGVARDDIAVLVVRVPGRG